MARRGGQDGLTALGRVTMTKWDPLPDREEGLDSRSCFLDYCGYVPVGICGHRRLDGQSDGPGLGLGETLDRFPGLGAGDPFHGARPQTVDPFAPAVGASIILVPSCR